MQKKLIVTGASSAIATELFKLIEKDTIKIITFGRGTSCDVQIDFNRFSDCQKFSLLLKSERPDYLFLNHGSLIGKNVMSYSESELNETFNCNLTSQLMALDALKEIEHLTTVVTSSISGKLSSFDTVYASCKAAVDLSIKATSLKIPASSRLNGVSPGIIEDAKMTTMRTDKEILEAKKQLTPTKKFTTASEVAQMVHYLLFEARNINGENININGGLF